MTPIAVSISEANGARRHGRTPVEGVNAKQKDSRRQTSHGQDISFFLKVGLKSAENFQGTRRHRRRKVYRVWGILFM